MGQKVSPHGLRVGIIKDWDSKWYADKKNFADFLVEDNKVREYVKKKLYVAGVSKVLIERAAENKMRVIVLTAKPGMVIGRSGDGIEVLKADLKKLTGKEIEISGKTYFLQKSYEAGYRQNNEGRRKGYQGYGIRKSRRR